MLAIATIALGADNTLGTSKYNTAKPKQAQGVCRLQGPPQRMKPSTAA
jgi:hypothetical protein